MRSDVVSAWRGRSLNTSGMCWRINGTSCKKTFSPMEVRRLSLLRALMKGIADSLLRYFFNHKNIIYFPNPEHVKAVLCDG